MEPKSDQSKYSALHTCGVLQPPGAFDSDSLTRAVWVWAMFLVWEPLVSPEEGDSRGTHLNPGEWQVRMAASFHTAFAESKQ